MRTPVVEVDGAAARFPPPTAPGYQRARQLGILPPPAPVTPPAPVAGLSSWDRLRLGVLLCFGGIGLALVVGDALGTLSLLLVSGAPFVVGGLLLRSTSARDEVEFAAGYTSTLTHPGLWRLARDGRVLRQPDRGVLPPGWYPSPYYPGLLQRWDGPGWKPLPQWWWHHQSSYFRPPDVPFL